MGQSFADYQARRTPSQRTIHVPLDGAAHSRVAELRQKVMAERADSAWASLAVPSHVAQWEEELAELERQLRHNVASFTFQAIPYLRLDQLKDECPPTAQQAAAGASWDYELLPRLLLVACSMEPKLTAADVQTIISEWDPWQVDLLTAAVWDVCNARTVVTPLSDSGSEQKAGTGPS